MMNTAVFLPMIPSCNSTATNHDYNDIYPTKKTKDDLVTAIIAPERKDLSFSKPSFDCTDTLTTSQISLTIHGIMKTNAVSSMDTPISSPRKVRFSNSCNEAGEGKNNFDLTIQIMYIESIPPSNRRLKSRLWYTAHDVKNIMQQNASTIMLMNMGYTDDTLMNGNEDVTLRRPYNNKNTRTEMTTRGLERYTKKGLARYQALHESSVLTVLREQLEGKHCSPMVRAERIAASYSKVAKEIQNTSNRRAMIDAKYVVENCWNDCTIDKIRQMQQLGHKRSRPTTSLFDCILPNRTC